MAMQGNSSGINTSSSSKKKFVAALRFLLLDFKPVLFIGALIVSYKYVENKVVSILMEYLLYLDSSGEENQRIAAIVRSLQDGLSSILFVIISLFSEAYTGCFTMITVCTAAFIEGLMLLWTSTLASESQAVYAAIFFLAFGNSCQSLLENFLEYQLQEISKTRNLRKQEHGSTQCKKMQDLMDKVLTRSWSFAPTVVGYILNTCISFTADDETYDQTFQFSALVVGGTYLLFLVGFVWYKHEGVTAESNLRKIYRICKASFKKWELNYPTSRDCYYGGEDYEGFYQSKHDKKQLIRISPRVPRLFKWLDKAAIKAEECSDPEARLEKKDKNGHLCSVEDVSEVKSLVPMIYLCFAFFAYSLLLATGNTFFVAQASSMTSNITKNGYDISVLFLIKEGVLYLSQFICFLISLVHGHFKATIVMCKKKATIIRIGFGMVCAVICSFIAWQVEVSRIKIIKEGHQDYLENSTLALIPQFVLLGTTEGLVGGGFSSLFYWHVAKSMQSFEDSFIELVIGNGKLFIVPIVLIFSNWFGKTVDTSRLDRYYLMLGILNAVFLVVFAYYSFRYAYKEKHLQGTDKQHSEKVKFNEKSSTIEGSTTTETIEIQSADQDVAEDNDEHHDYELTGDESCELTGDEICEHQNPVYCRSN